jgi:hypothetical protein
LLLLFQVVEFVKGLGRMEPSDLEFAHLKAIALFGPGKEDI